MRIPAAALILIISLLVSGLAIADQFDDATQAYKRGDYETAYRLIKPSAEQGLPEAQVNLGLMYDKGLGVPRDYVLAYMWSILATSGDPASEKTKRAEAEIIRDIAASKLTPAQIAEAQRWAREWTPKKEK